MRRLEKHRLNLGRHSFGSVCLEIGMIVFSILLALGLESWISGRHERGLTPPRLFKTAWKTALSTQVLARADYGLVLLIAQPYESQRWMAMVEEKWLQAILNPAAIDQNNRLRFLEILRSVTGEYLTLEKRLLPEYEQAIGRLAGA